MASGFPTANPSPQMEQPPGARTGAAFTGASGATLTAEEGDAVTVEIGDVEPVLGAHPHKSLTKLGSNWHWSGVIKPPCAPTDSNVEHGRVGCPGNSKIASGFPTANPSPQTLHAPSTVGIDDVEDGACGEAGAVEVGPCVAGVQEHTSLIRSGRKLQFSSEISPESPPSCSVPHKTEGCP